LQTLSEGALQLRITHFKGREMSIEHWSDQSLREVKDTVCQWVRDGSVDRVEIRDANGDLVFHYPLEMRRA
jgi:hypothetical protein